MKLPDWTGHTAVIAATGPSLVKDDVDYVTGKAVLIAVNDAHRLMPSADVLFASDAAWWRHHRYVKDFDGQRWTHDRNGSVWAAEAARNGINVIKGLTQNGISRDKSVIHLGGNSGFQALNLAVNCGARRIILLGFDCMHHSGMTHFFGDHPAPMRNSSPYEYFRKRFGVAAMQLAEMGVSVINCSRVTSLQCFDRIPLRQAL